MSTRRTFLQSALFLPSLLAAHAFAQDTNTPPSASFADFENGWGDWTLEGDAFGSAPATDAVFPGKIRGFGGRGFLCSLHPRKGNAAIGKAISREFTIEKPFITFKIGGGNFPGQACLNLVVDGQVVHTATGNGTPSLSDASWDVSALVGKKAHLEIVDSTTSANRGYVLVDDITFSDGVQTAKNETVVLRLQIVSVTDDDGSNGIALTVPQIRRAISDLNKAYAHADVQFVWDESADFSTIRSSYLNRDFEPTTDINILSRSDQKPPEPNISQHYEEWFKSSKSFPGKVPVFIASGSDWTWNAAIGKWRTMPSNISHGMPPFVFCRQITAMTHELGHLFGLVHTANFNRPMKTIEEVVLLIQNNISSGLPPENALGDLDLDKRFGVLDTLPSPDGNFYNKYLPRTDKVFTVQVRLPDGKEKDYQMDCRNPMGSAPGSFSPDQCRVIRANAEMWKREGGKYPVNAKPDKAIVYEFETLGFSERNLTGLRHLQFHRWHGGQRFVEIAGEHGQSFSVDLIIPKSSVYKVCLYAACAMNYGQLKVVIDNTEFDPIDLWGPHWFPDNAVQPRPSGCFILGNAKLAQGKVRCTFKIVGKNAQATGQSIGLQAIAFL